MCGICGTYGFNDEKLVREMASAISHRGPDDEGFYFNDNVGLGHRRLSIIDLTGGRQPIHNEDESIWISYNGEIYNFRELRNELELKGHRFYTNTDTEVIVHAYEEFGEMCVKKLNGMFAFAIYDQNKKTLFLARDRLGIKPLYYLQIGAKFVFASEEKAILKFDEYEPKVNIKILPYFFGFGYENTSSETLFNGIQKLPPGNTLTIDNNYNFKFNVYWDVNAIKSSKHFSEDFYAEKLLQMLSNSVQKRLISDVPVGAYLSGGLDSSSIVGLMSQFSDNVSTFSVGFGDNIENELDHSKKIAEHFSTDHHEITVEPDMLKMLDKIIWQVGSPINDFAIIPVYLMSKYAKKYATVVLSGDGADEVFGGYNASYQKHQKVHNFGRYVPRTVSKIMPTFTKILPISKLKYDINYAAKLWDNNDEYMTYTPIFRENENEYLYNQSIIENIRPIDKKTITQRDCFKDNVFWNGMLLYDLSTLLPNAFLPKLDRATMAVGVEARVPFLDHELVEFGYQIPHELKIKNNIEKYILKKAMHDVLPKQILKREKQGFGFPFYLANKELNKYAISILGESDIQNRGLFDPTYIRKLFSKTNNLSHKDGLRLWSLVSFELWYRMFIDD